MKNDIKVIAIDHGNRNIKTQNHVFPASYIECGHLPNMGGDILTYKGKDYTLVDKRMAQKNDKTKDESYFILTLFAIGKELVTNPYPKGECIEIELLAGLPPLHCKELGARHKEYYKSEGEQINFEFNKTPFSINIKDVSIYPQAFAAVATIHEKISEYKTINIVDIGGYTVDLLQLTDFEPNMTLCTSLYSGVNLFFQQINEMSRSKGMNDIPDNIIEGILLNDMSIILDASKKRIELVRESAKTFARELLDKISQSGIDLIENRTVFIGGGSILLKQYIERSNAVSKPIFIDNVHANVEGYKLLHDNKAIQILNKHGKGMASLIADSLCMYVHYGADFTGDLVTATPPIVQPQNDSQNKLNSALDSFF